VARTDLTVKQLTASTAIADLFASATAVDAVNGMQFVYAAGKRKLLVNNGSGSSVNVTVKTPAGRTSDGRTIADLVVAVGAGKIAEIKEAGVSLQADGKIYVDFASGTSVTAVVVEDS
jgi:hypothetical protein